MGRGLALHVYGVVRRSFLKSNDKSCLLRLQPLSVQSSSTFQGYLNLLCAGWVLS